MTMKSSLWIAQVIFVVLCGVGCRGDDGGVNIGINMGAGGGHVDIDLSAIPNPCESYTCQEDQRCTVVYHPGFFNVPVAHCVSTDTQNSAQKVSPGSCIEVKVGSNVMKCKTEEQWRNIGVTQCSLRGGDDTPPSLYSAQVAFACHRFDDSSEAVFLQAAFTCCPRLPDSTTKGQQDADSQQQAQTQVANDEIEDEIEDDDFEHNRVLVYPLLIAAATMVALIIIIVAVWQRRRSKLRRPKHPMLTITTSFVNPSAELEDEAPPTYDIMDEYTNRSDKSLLIVNEHTEYTPGN